MNFRTYKTSLKKGFLPLVLIAQVWIFNACQEPKTEPANRSMDPWAFRSVLDKKPRMLTLAFDTVNFAAYDLASGTLYKVWNGGVTKEGTVFTNKKNIQPTTWGAPYYEEGKLYNQWAVSRNGTPLQVELKYEGYLILDNHITLNFKLLLPDGESINIKENPEFTLNEKGEIGFERNFKINKPSADLSVSLQQAADKTAAIVIEDNSTVADYFEPVPKQEKPAISEGYDHLGILWMENSDCYTCHEEKNAMVGPSFKQIATKYLKTPANIALLTKKIISGGAGVWGDTPMNPHPDLKESEIKTILDYVFTFRPKDADDNTKSQLAKAKKVNPKKAEEKPPTKPGFGAALEGVHPSYDLTVLHNEKFQPRVGALAFLPDGRLLVSTWDSIGGIYALEGVTGDDPKKVKIQRIASGLAEPLGMEVVDGDVYVLQKHELTQLIDHDGDGIMDEYKVVCDGWGASDDFHEFAFGLVYKEDHFYITLSMAMRLLSTERQLPDRGRTLKISKDGSIERLDYGLRTPNGIGIGVDDQLFLTDNQGQWLPANKLIHVQKDNYNGMAWGLSAEQELNPPKASPPAIWLPDNEIGNSPGEPILMKDGPYKGQMLHGDVSNGGIKRDFLEKIKGQYQGVVFRFSQGFTAGVNRLVWGPDGALYVGEVGMVGGWSWKERQFGLEKIKYNGKSTFEMLTIKAKPDGFEIAFTEPVKEEGLNSILEKLVIEQYYYKATAAYGGPKLDLQRLKPDDIVLSNDGMRIDLKISGLKENHVVYFNLPEDLKSETGNSLWSSEAWYTLNKIPN
ncbi:c-type cytochrome [Cyclobacterium amurskyense]|uniref:c-type cytochrome n=1 Tax=Cyclobacterium amurskyense TaxID=320787 RepID=UPI0030D990FB|tara:strand:+ start:12911 stop:15292 length:2382 start_codon:yes stop_codon:yes gene_type:complete